jgi:hypothetical protein
VIRRAILVGLGSLVVLALTAPFNATAVAACEPKPTCFGVESLSASLSTTEAGAHPDVEFTFDVNKDPGSPLNAVGLHDSYAATRTVQFEFPPGLIADPNILGNSQQCTVAELSGGIEGECPNGSQIGIARIYTALPIVFSEPIYMMQPPGGDVVARVGFIAGFLPTFIDIRVRSEGDYGVTSEIVDSPATARLIRAETTLWGIPSAKSHDTERCTIHEAANGCVTSVSRPPGSRALPFWTNPTRCGVPLSLTAKAASWAEPERFDEKSASFPEINECDKLPFGPALAVEPTNHHTSAPTGLDLTIKLPPSDGVNVLEPSQTRDIRIDLPQGVGVNPGSANGLAVCSAAQVRFKERVASECPDAAKMASTEFEVGGLSRKLKGAIYLRQPEPGHLIRIWIVADDLGAHVKLPGEVEVDKQTGQLKSVVLENPQVPLREVKLLFKSGFRAPLATPSECGTYQTHYDFTPWSGGPPATGNTSMEIKEGCGGHGFGPTLSAGSADATAGAFTPFSFTTRRNDSEQNLSGLDITLPRGEAASFAGIPRCEGANAETGECPPGSRIGKTTVAVGVGPEPLWVPQPDKRPTAIYLGGPYKGAPFSIVAVVPAQAGPFDLGNEVVRSAIEVDPETVEATAKTDPLPQFKEGIPLAYKTINVELDRPGFALNPTSCARKQTLATLISTVGTIAHPNSLFAVSNCSRLPFKPKLSFRLIGGTHRGSHPQLVARLKMPAGGANLGAIQVALPHSEFIENSHFKTICTRVQFAAHECPTGSIYGVAVAKSPLFDFPLEGPVYLRSSNHLLPDLVLALRGPPSFPIEVDVDGSVDSVNGGLRTTFESLPDAPLTEATLHMEGGKKGLIVNSTNLCLKANHAVAKLKGQNGKAATLHPVLRASCKRGK